MGSTRRQLEWPQLDTHLWAEPDLLLAICRHFQTPVSSAVRKNTPAASVQTFSASLSPAARAAPSAAPAITLSRCGRRGRAGPHCLATLVSGLSLCRTGSREEFGRPPTTSVWERGGGDYCTPERESNWGFVGGGWGVYWGTCKAGPNSGHSGLRTSPFVLVPFLRGEVQYPVQYPPKIINH